MRRQYTQEDYDGIYKQLPQELQDAIFSMHTADVIREECAKYGIKDDRVSDVGGNVGDVLMGLVPPEELQDVLKENVEMPEVVAVAIADEIVREVVNPVRQHLVRLREDANNDSRTQEATDTQDVTKVIAEGTRLLQREDFEGAIAAFDEASTIDPKQASIYLNRAEALTKVGRHQEAEADRRTWQSLRGGTQGPARTPRRSLNDMLEGRDRAQEPQRARPAANAITGYVGLFKRSIAWFIDLMIVSMVATPVLAISSEAGESGLLSFIIIFPGQWLYWAFLESSPWQATLGKKLLGMIVVEEDGEPLTFAQANLRAFGKFLSMGFWFISAPMIASSDRKQAPHDRLAGTVVVNKR